ncbi:hypothetical protein SSX86_022822 [Deinandra increscens subsp. villosa]|uniref:Uncharacterized protein n=1 Tax=Deinandra increscens subsp. villosa TaxID=3103831 RepID=A0AAP0CPX3_9ASTR
MAYYDDAYMWADQEQHSTSFPVTSLDPVSFSCYEPYGVEANYDAYNASLFYEPRSIHLNGYDYDYDYEYGTCQNEYSYANPAVNYFAHNYMEPKLIAYEPTDCDTGYISYHTHYSISYSQEDLGFNEPEFEEYDSTPYGGGYDIVTVYGKPLPPSDQTCYPRSKPKPISPSLTPNSESQVAKPKPEPEPEPQTKPEPKPMPTPLFIATPIAEPEPESKPEPEPIHHPLELKEDRKGEEEEYKYPDHYGYDYPWPEYDNAYTTGVGYNYGYGKQVAQVPPCEYSPEVVDLCESIFGSWPCLARIRKQQMGIDHYNPRKTGPEIGHLDPWEQCASYFFGRPTVSYNA